MATAKPVMNVVQPAHGKATSRQLLVPIGVWQHPTYGQVEITPARAQAYLQSFLDGLRTVDVPGLGKCLPVNEGHNLTGPNRGYFYEPELTSEGLVFTFSWTPHGVQLIAERELPFLSPELLPTYADKQGRLHEFVLNGAGLVGRPFFDSVPAVEIQMANDAPPVGMMVFNDPQPAATQTADPPATPAATNLTAAAVVVPASANVNSFEEAQAFAAPPGHVLVLETELAALQLQRFDGELAALKFGDAAHPLVLTPTSRAPLAAVMAQLPPATARALSDALGGLSLVDLTTHGADDAMQFSDPLARTAPAGLSAEQKAVAAQLGLTEAQFLGKDEGK